MIYDDYDADGWTPMTEGERMGVLDGDEALDDEFREAFASFMEDSSGRRYIIEAEIHEDFYREAHEYAMTVKPLDELEGILGEEPHLNTTFMIRTAWLDGTTPWYVNAPQLPEVEA